MTKIQKCRGLILNFEIELYVTTYNESNMRYLQETKFKTNYTPNHGY